MPDHRPSVLSVRACWTRCTGNTHHHLLRFIRGQKVDREEAREILQETYCRLQQVPQIDAIQSHSGYLFRTAINLTRDRKRQRRREHPIAEAG